MSLPIAIQDRAALRDIQRHAPHALIIQGEEGLATRQVAEQIAVSAPSDIIRLAPQDNKSTISTEQVRDTIAKLRTYATTRRVIIIDPADAMTEPAQNALLKALEEPGANTHFLLITSHRNQLLATIQSRCQSLTLHRTSPAQDATLLADTTLTPAERQQILFLAGGRPAHILQLATQPKLFADYQAIAADAKLILTRAGRYDALAVLPRYQSDRQQALRLIDILLRFIKVQIAAGKTDRSLCAIHDKALYAEKLLAANGQVRLALLQLVV